jgi:hypothetical protein
MPSSDHQLALVAVPCVGDGPVELVIRAPAQRGAVFPMRRQAALDRLEAFRMQYASAILILQDALPDREKRGCLALMPDYGRADYQNIFPILRAAPKVEHHAIREPGDDEGVGLGWGRPAWAARAYPLANFAPAFRLREQFDYPTQRQFFHLRSSPFFFIFFLVNPYSCSLLISVFRCSPTRPRAWSGYA